MTFKIRIDIPDLELDLDEAALEKAIEESCLESMRVRGLPRGGNLRNLNSAAEEGAAEEIRRQQQQGGVIKG